MNTEGTTEATGVKSDVIADPGKYCGGASSPASGIAEKEPSGAIIAAWINAGTDTTKQLSGLPVQFDMLVQNMGKECDT
ncbi:MAG: hypothetical protein HQL80_07210 [Magnetococcales bacterium]|nr:hypothetical protein [Magnetococcales bacterium]